MTTEDSERSTFSYGVAREERVPARFLWCASAILAVGASEMAVVVFVEDKLMETTIIACIALCASLTMLAILFSLVRKDRSNG